MTNEKLTYEFKAHLKIPEVHKQVMPLLKLLSFHLSKIVHQIECWDIQNYNSDITQRYRQNYNNNNS